MSAVTHDPIDPARLLAAVADRERGATVLFLGSVRRSADDGDVRAIEYSAYEEMVRDESARIVQEAAAQWPDARVVLQHRVGNVGAGEPSIAVAAAAPHRPAAFDAARWVVEQAKRRLPVWKREEFDDGSSRWREDQGRAHPLTRADEA
ncbi:MAG TPA: molybdenum cofactor biosynthesis protein MoaE [Gemmatimonadales bacterium]|jgi:molybdopterin synthase catalytic subunit